MAAVSDSFSTSAPFCRSYVYDDSVFKFAKLEIRNLHILDGYLVPSEYAPIFPKNEKGQALADQYSEFVKKLWASGLENYIRILFQIALFLS